MDSHIKQLSRSLDLKTIITNISSNPRAIKLIKKYPIHIVNLYSNPNPKVLDLILPLNNPIYQNKGLDILLAMCMNKLCTQILNKHNMTFNEFFEWVKNNDSRQLNWVFYHNNCLENMCRYSEEEINDKELPLNVKYLAANPNDWAINYIKKIDPDTLDKKTILELLANPNPLALDIALGSKWVRNQIKNINPDTNDTISILTSLAHNPNDKAIDCLFAHIHNPDVLSHIFCVIATYINPNDRILHLIDANINNPKFQIKTYAPMLIVNKNPLAFFIMRNHNIPVKVSNKEIVDYAFNINNYTNGNAIDYLGLNRKKSDHIIGTRIAIEYLKTNETLMNRALPDLLATPEIFVPDTRIIKRLVSSD